MDTGSTLPKDTRYRGTGLALLAGGFALLVLAGIIGISDNPPGITSMLVGMLAIALGILYLFTRAGGRSPGQQLLYWSPRALSIVFALFVSMFAADVFEEGRGFWQTAVALFMHLIPTFLLILVLAVSWKREWIAGILFPLLGAFYVFWSWGKPFFHLSVMLLMAGPLVLTGVLFLLNWYYRGRLRGTATRTA